jgi:hypothetical protein
MWKRVVLQQNQQRAAWQATARGIVKVNRDAACLCNDGAIK